VWPTCRGGWLAPRETLKQAQTRFATLQEQQQAVRQQLTATTERNETLQTSWHELGTLGTKLKNVHKGLKTS
jgi:hypothetical protein